MIDTSMGKSVGAMPGAPMGGMAKANAPMPGRTANRRIPMTPHGMAGKAMGAVKSFFGGKKRPPMGAAGAGMPGTVTPGNMPPVPGQYDPMNKSMGNPGMGEPMGGPVMDTAPPMYEPPPMGEGGGMQNVDPMMMEKLRQRMGGNTGVNGGMLAQKYGMY